MTMIILDRRTQEPMCKIPADNLAGLDLRPFLLRYADLSDLDLSHCICDDMDLEGIQASNSILNGIKMRNCNMSETIFNRVNAPGAMFCGSRFSITAFPYALLHGADFSEIIIEGMVNFRWIRAHRSKFRNIKNLRPANFFEADLTNAELEGSDFTQIGDSERTGIVLTGTIFEHLMTV